MSEILYACSDHVAEITINRPEKGNALNAAAREQLFTAFRRANEDADCRAVILTAAGQRVFSAGADLAEMASMGIGLPPKDFVPVLRKNVDMDKPVIAAVNGLVIAGGFLMFQMCDLVVASSAATFAISEAKRGRGFPWAMPLAHMMPRRVLTELLVTGEPISAQRAFDIGLVNRLVEPAEVMNEARSLARAIAANAPLTVRAALLMMRNADEMGIGAAERMAEVIFKDVYTSEDAQEGPRAFIEKRPPIWKGR